MHIRATKMIIHQQKTKHVEQNRYIHQTLSTNKKSFFHTRIESSKPEVHLSPSKQLGNQLPSADSDWGMIDPGLMRLFTHNFGSSGASIKHVATYHSLHIMKEIWT